MILADKSLRELLAEMQFETAEHQRPFKPDEQVQPCSIDLRLDRFFWEPRQPTPGLRRFPPAHSSLVG